MAEELLVSRQKGDTGSAFASTLTVNDSTTPFPNNGAHSMGGWIRDDRDGSGTNILIATHSGFNFAIEADGSITFHVFGYATLGTGVKIAPRTWTHLFFTLNGSTYKVYFNGELISTFTLVRAYTASAQISFGIANPTTKQRQLDNMSAWSRELSQAEIQALMAGAPLNLTGCYVYYPGTITGGQIMDASGNNRHITASGVVIAPTTAPVTTQQEQVLVSQEYQKGVRVRANSAQAITGSDAKFPMGNTPRTISFWFTPFRTDIDYNILGYGAGGSFGLFDIMLIGKKITVHNQQNGAFSNYTVGVNNPVFISITYAGGTTVEFFVYGVSVGTASTTQVLNTLPGQLDIGNGIYPSYKGSTGHIVGELQVWEGVRTAAQLVEDMNGIEAPLDEPTLKFYSKLNQLPAIDLSANPVTLTTQTFVVLKEIGPTPLPVTEERALVADNNMAIRLYGQSEYVALPNVAALNLAGDMSILARVRPLADKDFSTITSKVGGDNNTSLQWWLRIQSGQLVVYASDGTAPRSILYATPLKRATWYLILFVIEGSTMKLSVDGSAFLTTILSGPRSTTTNAAHIGTISQTPGVYGFLGDIDYVRFFGRALAIGEEATDYIAAYEFEENANDSGPNALHGAIKKGATAHVPQYVGV